MKKIYWFCIVMLVAAVGSGCDTSKEEPVAKSSNEAESSAETKTEAPEGPIAIASLKVLGSQSTMLHEGAPSSDQVKEAVEDALYDTEAFSEDGERKAQGSLTYDIRSIDKKDGNAAVDVAIFGDLMVRDEPIELSAKVIVGNDENPNASVRDLVNKAVSGLALQLDGQARVMDSEDGELLDFIADEDEDASARLAAVQQARDRRLTGAASTIEPLLEDDDERLRVAAAAALVAFKKQETYSKVIGVAERFSRDRNPQLMPLLYIVGDMNTDESKTYLKTVAEAHSEPTVRKIAEEALNRGKGAK